MATTMTSSTAPPSQLGNSSSAPDMTSRNRPHSHQSSRRTSHQRPTSYAKNRMSSYSTTTQNRSRPVSHASPKFQSSLPYALVRDFAYPSDDPLHYGPPPKDSSVTTPVSESQRFSDPPSSWNPSHSSWPVPNWNPEAMYGQQQLPAMAFGDGPPYSEDEDLHSPVITTSRRRKNKSGDRGVFVGVNSDGSETYFIRDEDAGEDGSGGEYVTYPPDQARYSYLSPGSYAQGDSNSVPFDPGFEFDSDDEIPEDETFDPSRYSRDYQFTIVSPDEEMHGKAVALFDFTREHENELPLTEGQVILVSYRHGQGWLVAEDPKTGESGLVPEEFVRLVRDIEGGLNSLNGDLSTPMDVDDAPGPDIEATPTDISPSDSTSPQDISNSEPRNGRDEVNDGSNHVDNLNDNTTARKGSREGTGSPNQIDKSENSKGKGATKDPAVISTFSTSSRDWSPSRQHTGSSGHQHTRSSPPKVDHQAGTSSGSGGNISNRPKSMAKLKNAHD